MLQHHSLVEYPKAILTDYNKVIEIPQSFDFNFNPIKDLSTALCDANSTNRHLTVSNNKFL